MRETLHVEIAVEEPETAVRRQRPAPGLIFHTDRGIQHACEDYRKALDKAKTAPSMGRKGDRLDNAHPLGRMLRMRLPGSGWRASSDR